MATVSRPLWQRGYRIRLQAVLLLLLLVASLGGVGGLSFWGIQKCRRRRSHGNVGMAFSEATTTPVVSQDVACNREEADGVAEQPDRVLPKPLSSNRISATVTNNNITSVQDIASLITLEQCPLLGVKSIGVDFGLVRTGVAVTVGYDPKPITILTDLNNTQVCQRVLECARAERASKIIVGLPLHKNGTVAEQTNLTWQFATELAAAALATWGPNDVVTVELWDERYTSKEAAARAHARNPHRRLYGSLDAEAACIILEHYYHDHGQGRILVPVANATVRQACLEQYEARQRHEAERRRNLTLQRQERIQQRREDAMARALQQTADPSASKKKKKKKKRRRQ